MNYLVFDIGGTALKYAIINHEDIILEKGEIKTPLESIEKFVESIKKIYINYKTGIKGIAMSLPGRIDSEKGYAYSGGSLLYNTEKNIAKIISESCDKLPVIIENDGKCAAIAEATKGNLSDVDDGIVLILGTGIGGGIIKNKNIHRGKEFVAGEFSFIVTGSSSDSQRPLNMFGFECGVPSGICKPFAKIKGLENKDVNGKIFFKELLSGDKDADKILNEYCYKLSIQLMNLQHIYNPEKIAIGGGISAQDILMEYIKKNLDKVINNMPVILSKPNIVRCKFKNDANLIGAMANFKKKCKE